MGGRLALWYHIYGSLCEQQKKFRQILFQRIYYLSISLTGLPCHREPSIVLMSMTPPNSILFIVGSIILHRYHNIQYIYESHQQPFSIIIYIFYRCLFPDIWAYFLFRTWQRAIIPHTRPNRFNHLIITYAFK